MGQQTVEVTFQGEQIGSHTDKKNTTYTLYSVAPDSVADDLYVVHVDEGDESWLETNGHQGMSEGMLGTFFPELAEAFVGERVFPHNKHRRARLLYTQPPRSGRSGGGLPDVRE